MTQVIDWFQQSPDDKIQTDNENLHHFCGGHFYSLELNASIILMPFNLK